MSAAEKPHERIYGVAVWVRGPGLTPEQAMQVLVERINVDEDYGFEYRIEFDDVNMHELGVGPVAS